MSERDRADHAQLDAWLDRLLDAPRTERAKILESCEDDALRGRLRALLGAESDNGPLDETPNALARSAIESASPTQHGVRIGAYRIASLLGEGGSATVWLATRDDGTITHDVAVKCLKSGLATPEQRARFVREQQILARLTHPNVARLYDVGINVDGVPYIVMERIDGQPITRWCDARELSIDDRLNLFRTVLAAAAFAHQNLVVHRDLKPGNILVNADGAPKLLDFGIAKLLGDGDDATRTQARVLTPGYAAPEQFGGGAITTATDVYALGIVLYELLCGSRPTRDDDPAQELPAPSDYVRQWLRRRHDTQLHPADAAARDRRLADAQRLARLLDGDLDALILTAVAPDPTRRYATIAAFDADIENYLHGRPLLARRTGAAYRLRKYVTRHWLAIGASTAVLLALVIGSGLALWQAQQARRSAARAEAVQNFLLGVFDAAQAGPRGSTVLTNRELAGRAAAGLRERLANEPDAGAQLLLAVGRVFRKMSINDEAVSMFERAVALQRAASPSDPLALATALGALGAAYDAIGEFARADKAIEEALQLERAHGAEAVQQADTLIDKAAVDIDLGKSDATATIDAALRELDRIPDASPDLRLRALMVRTAILRRVGDPKGSVAGARDALALAQSAFGADAPQTARAWNLLGNGLRQTGQLDEAERALGELIRYDREIAHQMEPQHLYSLGTLQIDAGNYVAAADTLEQALQTERITTGADVTDLGSFQEPLARAFLELGRLAEAEPLARDAVARYERADAGAGGELAQMRLTLADILRAKKADAEAAQLYRQVLDVAGSLHSRRGRELRLFAQLGSIATNKSDPQTIAASTKEVLESPDFTADTEPLSRLHVYAQAGEILLAAQQFALAETNAMTALSMATALPRDLPLVARLHLICARALVAMRRAADAKPHITAALVVLQQRLPAEHPLRVGAQALVEQIDIAVATNH